MTTVVAVLVLAGLFLAYPLIRRERSAGCGGRGCWKKQLGLGCGDCPVAGPARRADGSESGSRDPDSAR